MDVQPPLEASRRGRASRRLATVAIAAFVAATALVSVRSSSAPERTPHPAAVARALAEPPDPQTARLAAARAIAHTLSPLPSRRLPEPTRKEQQLSQLSAALKAPGAPVENPCTQWAGPFCVRTTLDPFFSALDSLRAGKASSAVTVSAFGNSLIASDRIVDVVREDLVRVFGDGGRGLLLVDKLADYGPRVRTGSSASGWKVHTVGELPAAAWPFGITGAVHISDTPRARARFALAGERKGSLFWVDKDAGPIELRADGELLIQTSPRDDGHSQRTEFTLPERASALELIAHKSGTALHGLVLDRPAPGIALDTMGIVAADASLFLRADEQMVTDELRARDPALVLIILGGNEVKRLQWGRSTFEKVEADLRRFIQRTKKGAPASACLIVGPLDAVLGPEAPRPFQQRAELREVIELERKISLEEGCAFFDMFAAMGGSGSLERFNTRGLLNEDLVHPRGQGLDVLGELLSVALLKSWSETPRPERPYALAEAWATLVGADLLPHEVQAWRQAPAVALLPGSPADPLSGGIQRVLSAARVWTPRSEDARWLVLGAGEAHSLPRTLATAGPVNTRCVALMPASGTVHPGDPCVSLTLPSLPEDLRDPLDRGVTVGAWLLAELVRHDSSPVARSTH